MTTGPSLDLRSDTVTRPSAAMRRAMADAEVGDDVLDGDPTTQRLEATVAERLGKEAALFFPSGSMANQAAVWLLAARGTEVYCDADAHVLHWELAALAGINGVQARAVRGDASVMHAAALRRAQREPSTYAPRASLVCLENTHNGAGGVVTREADLRALRDVAQEFALPVHLDGARLWNAHVATGTSLAAFAACADTVMVSFSKGLGAPVGAALAGPRDVIAEARVVRKRLGGGMRQIGVLAAAAQYGLEHHLAGLADDHDAARALAQAIGGVPGARVVPPDTNIVMVDLARPCAAAVVDALAPLGIRASTWHEARVRFVTHRDAPREAVEAAAPRVAAAIGDVLVRAASHD